MEMLIENIEGGKTQFQIFRFEHLCIKKMLAWGCIFNSLWGTLSVLNVTNVKLINTLQCFQDSWSSGNDFLFLQLWLLHLAGKSGQNC